MCRIELSFYWHGCAGNLKDKLEKVLGLQPNVSQKSMDHYYDRVARNSRDLQEYLSQSSSAKFFRGDNGSTYESWSDVLRILGLARNPKSLLVAEIRSQRIANRYNDFLKSIENWATKKLPASKFPLSPANTTALLKMLEAVHSTEMDRQLGTAHHGYKPLEFSFAI